MPSLHRRQTPEDWTVGLGVGPEESGLKQVILHGAYTHPEGGYDVALLLLAQPVTLGPSLRPLCLPYSDHYLPDGERGWVLGLARQGAGVWTGEGSQSWACSLEAEVPAGSSPSPCRHRLPSDSACDPPGAQGL